MEKQQLIQDYIKRVDLAIENSLSNKTKLSEEQFNIDGMSSRKVRIFLNELLSQNSKEVNYLEIGTWLGSTLISALYKNEVNSAVAIDNFSQFSGTYDKFISNCQKSGVDKFEFINSDCFNLSDDDKQKIKHINIYFYDGDHTHEDQTKALTYYNEFLQNVFILIVDDWNHNPVKTGTSQGISEANLVVHKQWELHANMNGDINNWWNGLYIAICEKNT